MEELLALPGMLRRVEESLIGRRDIFASLQIDNKDNLETQMVIRRRYCLLLSLGIFYPDVELLDAGPIANRREHFVQVPLVLRPCCVFCRLDYDCRTVHRRAEHRIGFLRRLCSLFGLTF